MTPEQVQVNILYLLGGALGGPIAGMLAILSVSRRIRVGYDKRVRTLSGGTVIITAINIVLPLAVLLGFTEWPAAALFTAGFLALGVPFFAWATYGYGVLTGQIESKSPGLGKVPGGREKEDSP